MADIEFIRRLHVGGGWSERRIAREFGYGRNTVHRLLDRSQPTTAPVYRRSKPVRAPKMGRYREIIDSWLIADQAAPRKQRHTAHRIYDRLVSEYDATDLAESSVRRYVRQRRELVAPKAAPAFLHLEFGPGQVAQVDWGEATVRLAGRQVTVWMFCMRLCHSTKPFVAVYPHGRMECFLEGHIQAFAWFGGIPAEIIYDNLGSAVQRVLSRRGRLLNAAFQTFVAHYLFKPVFANLAAGWEKGLVEGLVGTARRNYLVPVPDVSCLQEVNTHLLHGIDRDADHVVPERDGRSVRELFAEDRQGLISLPPSVFPACTRHSVHVSHQCTVRHQQVQYSVPAQLVGRDLELRAFSDHIDIYDRARRVASHHLGTPGQTPVLELDHYLDVLMRKPGGVRHARVVNQLGAEATAYRDAFLSHNPDAYGSFVQILLLCRRYTRDAVLAGIAQARAEHIYDVSRVEALIAKALGQPQAVITVVPAGPVVRQPTLEAYDALLPAAGVVA